MPASFTAPNGADPALYVARRVAAGLITADDMRYAAEREKARIISRTGRGIDVKGQAFAAYSDRYKKRKEKSGRNSGIVDLTWSGRMLKALVTRNVTAKSFIIGIYGEEGTRATAHNQGGGHMPVRKFFPTRQDQDIAAINEDLRTRRNARLQGTPLNAA